MDQADQLAERIARAHAQPDPTMLWWRASLGQATFDLLATGKSVTLETLIDHLEADVPPDDLVNKALSRKAAISVLRSLSEASTPSEE